VTLVEIDDRLVVLSERDPGAQGETDVDILRGAGGAIGVTLVRSLADVEAEGCIAARQIDDAPHGDVALRRSGRAEKLERTIRYDAPKVESLAKGGV